jgi:hypothetical protein
MTMTLCGNLDVALLVCLCFVWGSQVGCGGVPSVVVFHDNIGALYGFSAGSLQMNRSILFYFFNKIRQNCPFCSKTISHGTFYGRSNKDGTTLIL